MISKNTFCKALQLIQEQEDIYDEVSKALDKVLDGSFLLGCDNRFLSALVMVLEETMGDKYEYISWWLWEAPEDSKTVEEVNGCKHDLKEPEALFDFLVKFRED